MTKVPSKASLGLAMIFAAAIAGTSFAQTGQSGQSGAAGGGTGHEAAAGQGVESDPAQSTTAAPETTQSADVCALEWTQADANADGSLTEEEAQGDLKEQFASVDTDQDGMITQEEYETCGSA